MESISWTNRQIEAIEDNKHNLLVSAAAGSGKTAVLVEKIIQLVTKNGIDIDKMLIVSFTDAAATQMKNKIYEALAKEGLEDQIEKMNRASICTLSSFAYSVVKNYYHFIGVDPACSICDEIKAALLQREALDDMYEEFFEKQDKDFLYILDRYEKKINDESVKATILGLRRFLMSMPNPWGWAKAACSEDFDIEKYISFAKDYLFESLSYAKAYYQKYTNALQEANLVKEAEKSKNDISFVDDLIASLSNGDNCFDNIANASNRVASLGKSEGYVAIKDVIQPYRDYAKKCIKDANAFASKISEEKLKEEYTLTAEVLNKWFKLVKRFDEIYKEKKAEEKLLDFSDVEHYALEILSNEVAKKEYKEKFEFVFIDEYQDVNSLQEALIQSIAKENNLFMVGDVKQSIYQFRLAEPSLFINHYEDYKFNENEFNRAIDLNTNFRSKKTVIDTVNDFFRILMTKESCNIIYDKDAELVQGSPYEGELEYPVKLEILNSENDNADELISDLKNIEKEAAHAASIIKKYYKKEIYDDKKKCVRPLDYRDMAVLLRTAKHKGEIYYKTFLDAGIPVYFDRGEGFFETLEIEILLNLLKLVCNKKQDLPLLSVLTCPIFGFTADELAQIRINHPEGYFYEAFFDSDKPSDKQKAFTELLEALKKDQKALPLAEFINKLMLRSGYIDYCAALNAGSQRLANLKTLVDKACIFEQNNLSGLAGFISFVEMLKSRNNVDMGQAKAVSESMDCVRIMTIHKSKGLEFPFVLVAGINASKRKGKSNNIVSCHKDFGAALKLVNPENNTFTNTSLLEIIKAKKDADERAEAIRLLYVAMTRAKDILVFSAFNKIDQAYLDSFKMLIPTDRVNAGGYFSMVYPLMESANVSELDQNYIASSLSKTFGLTKEFENKINSISEFGEIESVSEVMDYIYFPQIGKHKKKYSVSQIAEEQRTGFINKELVVGDEDEIISCETPAFLKQGEQKLSATEKGTAYHAVMEHLPFTEEYNNIESIKKLILDLKEKNILSPAEANCVDAKRIKAFFDTDIGKRALTSKEIHKEAPFTMKYNYDGQDVLVQGTIDCYFEEDGEYVLVDYKSNYVDMSNKDAAYEYLKENYLPQIRLYKEALEQICSAKVKQSALYLFGTGEILEVKE